MSETSKFVLCPYCGHMQPAASRCDECNGLFEPLSRRATQIAMGPWYIRDKNSPFRPGCSYEVLRKQIRAGKIKPTTVLRGPTTRQFWSVARHVPGVAHLLGYCHHCGLRVKTDALACSSCMEPFREVAQRDEMGLMFPTAADAGAAQRALDKEIAQLAGEAAYMKPAARRGDARPSSSSIGGAQASGVDLLDEVVGEVAARSAPPRQKKRKPREEPKAVVPEAISFTPSEESDIASAGRGGRSSVMIWAMAIVILMLLGLLVWMAMNWQNDRQNDSPSHAAGTIESPERENSQRSLFAPESETDARPAGPTEAAPPSEARPLDAGVAWTSAKVHELLTQASELQSQDKLPEALAKYREVARIAGPRDAPKNLNEVMKSLEDEITRRKANFFGISTTH